MLYRRPRCVEHKCLALVDGAIERPLSASSWWLVVLSVVRRLPVWRHHVLARLPVRAGIAQPLTKAAIET